MVLSFTISVGPRQRSRSQVRVPRTHDHVLLSQIREFPNLEGQVPVFVSPRNRMGRLYLQAPGSLFVASYDSTETVPCSVSYNWYNKTLSVTDLIEYIKLDVWLFMFRSLGSILRGMTMKGNQLCIVIDLKFWFTLIRCKMFIKIFVKRFCCKNTAIQAFGIIYYTNSTSRRILCY
jgi:hypothetical protein